MMIHQQSVWFLRLVTSKLQFRHSWELPWVLWMPCLSQYFTTRTLCFFRNNFWIVFNEGSQKGCKSKEWFQLALILWLFHVADCIYLLWVEQYTFAREYNTEKRVFFFHKFTFRFFQSQIQTAQFAKKLLIMLLLCLSPNDYVVWYILNTF